MHLTFNVFFATMEILSIPANAMQIARFPLESQVKLLQFIVESLGHV